MERGGAPVQVDRKGVHLNIDDVPNWICRQFGEARFEEAEVESIQTILWAVNKEKGETGEDVLTKAIPAGTTPQE